MAARQYINPTTASARDWQRGNLGAGGQTSLLQILLEENKPVTFADGGFALATDGQEIAGFLTAINPALETGGYNYVSVQTEGVVIAQIVSGGSHVAIGDVVVSATNAGAGTANPNVTGDPIGTIVRCPIVKKEASPVAGKKYWKVVDLRGGSGVDTTTVSISYC